MAPLLSGFLWTVAGSLWRKLVKGVCRRVLWRDGRGSGGQKRGDSADKPRPKSAETKELNAGLTTRITRKRALSNGVGRKLGTLTKTGRRKWNPQERLLREPSNKSTGPTTLRILALNVDGLRLKRKRNALGTYVAGLDPQPDVCIISETHLLETEVDWVHYDTYERAHYSCRDIDVTQACGGVLILVKTGLGYRKVDDRPNVQQPLNGSSILVYTRDEHVPAVRITGVYFTPAARPREEQVKMLTDKRSDMIVDGSRIGHIIGGDLNPPSWTAEYAKWMSNAGARALTDPEQPTFGSGNALDKFLYVPGDTIPGNFLQQQRRMGSKRRRCTAIRVVLALKRR